MRACSCSVLGRLSSRISSPKSLSPCIGAARWSSTSNRQWSTPLAKTIAEAIDTTGPISVAAYMRQCLTSPDGGYYTQQREGRDPFGQKGDFITAPEISQIFGELVGIWVLAEWMAQGRKSSGVQIIEVGPGRGTLMDDMLRVIHNNKQMAPSVEAIYLVEASPSLRDQQKNLLCGDAPLTPTDIGWESTCKYLNGVKVVWCEDLKMVPKTAENSPFIVAHEFFDALPIHVFQSVPQPAAPPAITTSTSPSATPSPSPATNQWRELVVTPTPPNSTHSTVSMPVSQRSSNPDVPDFQLTVSKLPTPHSLLLPNTSERYRALKSQTGAVIEISPESIIYASEFATRIGGSGGAPPKAPLPSGSKAPAPFNKSQPSGAALIIDYGPSSTIPSNSLRGIRSHRTVSPFSSPGLVDLSADVDFLGLAHAALDASPNVEVHTAIEQAQFLKSMGIEVRAKILMDAVKEEGSKGEERKKSIEGSVTRLLERGPMGMGKIYKVMAITPFIPQPEGAKRRRPVGFGGDIE